jgi:hypothetical protein
MTFVESLRKKTGTREVLHFADQMLRVSGLVFMLMLVGVVIALAYAAKPDQHSFQWFITRTCPKAYGNLMQVIKHAPPRQSDFYQACVNEEVSRGLH